MQSRLYFSELGNAFLRRYTAPGVCPQNRVSWHSSRRYHAFAYLQREEESAKGHNYKLRKYFSQDERSLTSDERQTGFINATPKRTIRKRDSILKVLVEHGPLTVQSIRKRLDASSDLEQTIALKELQGHLNILSRDHKVQNLTYQKKDRARPEYWAAISGKDVNARTIRLSPPKYLARFLDDKENFGAQMQHELLRKEHNYASALPTILVFYLGRAEEWTFETSREGLKWFALEAEETLQKRGLSDSDVARWAWILSSSDITVVAERFLSSTHEEPTFLLLEILRRNTMSVRTLKLLLIYTWDHIMGKPVSKLTTLSELEIDSRIPWSEVTQFSFQETNPTYRPRKLEETTYEMILTRLAVHMCRLWSPALLSLAHMVAPIMYSSYSLGSDGSKMLEPSTHRKACKLLNRMLCSLARPASIEPFKSMSHNWQAQKVLLKLAGQFEPPLFLDQSGYHAVLGVLTAQKKSENESRTSNLRSRSWPPWRVDQDGMDAQRSLEEDFSRVVSAAISAKESGYQETVRDRALKILGGQEPDGTPTIQTRRLVKAPTPVRAPDYPAYLSWGVRPPRDSMYRPPGFPRDFIYRPLESKLSETPAPRLLPNAQEWAARVTATRDVQEAWTAFLHFQEQGGIPDLSMYYAMFQKLGFERVRIGRQAQYDASPGDGQEVLSPLDDNFSKFYQLSRQPISADALYEQMIKLPHCRPSGRFLNFLILNARTPNEGLRYLQDSQLDFQVISFIRDLKDIDPAVLRDRLSGATLTAVISMLCRFAPRVVAATEDTKSPTSNSKEPSDEATDAAEQLSILEIHNHAGRPIINPLLHSAQLLTRSQTHFRPAWYALFRGLTRRGVVVDRNLAGDPQNDLLSWKVLVAALGDFHRNGLELDPYGFLIICYGLEKAIIASLNVPADGDKPALGSSQILLVVDQFMKMTEFIESKEEFKIPDLLHAIGGVHIHAYVRVLGLAEDYHGMMYVLEWMVKHHRALDEIAALSRNGAKMIRRVFIAMRVFFHGTDYESSAEGLVESIGCWDGWPSEYEAEQYNEQGSATENELPDEAFDEEDPEETATGYMAR